MSWGGMSLVASLDDISHEAPRPERGRIASLSVCMEEMIDVLRMF